MRRKLSLGGLFLLFLLFCAILSYIHPDTISTDDTFPYTENTISYTEDTTPTEDTNTWEEDTIFCTSVIDGDTFRLETGETVRLMGIDAPELSLILKVSVKQPQIVIPGHASIRSGAPMYHLPIIVSPSF